MSQYLINKENVEALGVLDAIYKVAIKHTWNDFIVIVDGILIDCPAELPLDADERVILVCKVNY